MKPLVFTLSNASGGALFSKIAVMDFYSTPANISLQILVIGTANCTAQYTFDDVFAPGYNPMTGNWTNHPQLVNITATLDSNIAFPVTAIRYTQTSGAGSSRFTIIQAG